MREPLTDAAAVQDAFEHMLGLGAEAARAPVPLTLAESDLLDAADFTPASETEAATAVARTAAAYAAVAGDTVSVGDLAQAWGKSPGRIRQMISEGKLVALKAGKHNRLPRFQFTTDDQGDLAPVPGADRVFQTLAPGLSPVATAHWFQQPNAELYPVDQRVADDAPDAPLSPKAWLIAGLDTAPVIASAKALAGEPDETANDPDESASHSIVTMLATLKQLDRQAHKRSSHQMIDRAMLLLKQLQQDL